MILFKALILTCFLAITTAVAAQEPLVFSSQAEEQRFLDLTTELRCLVCQNQTIADSDAPLAQDLRKEMMDVKNT